MLVTLPSSPWPVDHFQVVNCLNEVKTKKGRERWFQFLCTYMYLFIKHLLQKNLCIETVYRFIQSEMTSVHTMSVDTSLLIFNNGWTCTLLNTWSHKRYHWLVHLVASLSPPGCITRDMTLPKVKSALRTMLWDVAGASTLFVFNYTTPGWADDIRKYWYHLRNRNKSSLSTHYIARVDMVFKKSPYIQW